MQDGDSAATPSAADVTYQVFMLGLALLHESFPEERVRRGSSVMAAISLANPVFKQMRPLAEQAWDLRALVLEHAQIHEGEKPPNKKELAKLITTSDKHTILIAKPPIEVASSDFSPQALFGPKGHSFAITDAGIAFAMQFATRYEELLTAEKCVAGWREYRRQVRYTLGTQRKAPKANESSDQGAAPEAWRGSIPQAPNVEHEW